MRPVAKGPVRPVVTGPSARKQAALAKLEAQHAPQPSRFLTEVSMEGPTLGELVAMQEVSLSSRSLHNLLPIYAKASVAVKQL